MCDIPEFGAKTWFLIPADRVKENLGSSPSPGVEMEEQRGRRITEYKVTLYLLYVEIEASLDYMILLNE